MTDIWAEDAEVFLVIPKGSAIPFHGELPFVVAANSVTFEKPVCMFRLSFHIY